MGASDTALRPCRTKVGARQTGPSIAEGFNGHVPSQLPALPFTIAGSTLC
jgi:hypothetical protein